VGNEEKIYLEILLDYKERKNFIEIKENKWNRI